MFNHLWFAFKLLFSVTLVVAPISLLVAAPHAMTDPVFIGISSILLFFAALPWVNFTTPNRALGLVGIIFSFCIAFLAVQMEFPRSCTGHRVLFCEFENLLFLVGGKFLAAAPFAALAAFVFVGSMRILIRANRV